MNGPILVIKLGGSLLDCPAWPDRLARLLASRPEARPVLIVGGGKFADTLRDLDSIHALGELRSHALALRILDATAQIAAALLPGSVVVDDVADLPLTWASGSTPVLAPRRFLELDDRSPDPLPHAWTTTTDSIAARVAVRLRASELILLKSLPLPPEAPTWEDAAALGLVDPEFPRAVEKIPKTRLICLKDSDTVFGEGISSSRL